MEESIFVDEELQGFNSDKNDPLHPSTLSSEHVPASTHEVETHVDVSYAAPQAHGIVNVTFHQEYSTDIVFIFFQRRKDLYHV
jgi:hypothetical protein